MPTPTSTVTRGDMLDIEVGQVPGPHVRAIMALSSAINRSEGNGCSVSWEMQERARAFYNEHGMAATLDECRRLGSALVTTWAPVRSKHV